MELPSSHDIHRLTIEEFDTTKLLAHAARQARQRKYSEFMIVDIDSHHYETDHLSEIYEYIEAPVIKQLGKTFHKTMGLPLFPQRGNDQEMGGRITRSPLRRMEKSPSQGRRQARHRAGAALDECDGRRLHLPVPDTDAVVRAAPAGRDRGGACRAAIIAGCANGFLRTSRG